MGEAKRRGIARAKLEVQGWMALAMFGCHCGEHAPDFSYAGSWICTHVAKAHPELYFMQKLAQEKHVFSVRYR